MVYEFRMEDRRTSPRREAYLSAELATNEGQSTIAITRDISPTGILLFSRIKLEVGQLVTLSVLDGTQYTITGRVVREEQLEFHELWTSKVAISLDADDPVLAKIHASLADPASVEDRPPHG